MARNRIATDRVALMQRGPIERALEASLAAGDDGEFYRVVGMRNPSRSYFVRYGGRLHSLKPVMTHALQEERSDTLAREFHAADAAERLRVLGFEVEHAGE